MADKPETYYQYWAEELNRRLGVADTWDAEMVAYIERLIGKPVAEMTVSDLRRGCELAEREHAEAAKWMSRN